MANFASHQFNYYREFGLTVIPVQADSKKPPETLKWKKFLGGEKPTEAMYAWWAKQWPSCNFGVLTGSCNRLLVIDVDEATDENQAFVSRLPRTSVAKTSKGYHYYFRIPEGLTLETKIRFLRGVDCKAEGGYVLAPPSVHPDGSVYDWVLPLVDEETGESFLADLPQWVIEFFAEQKGLLESTSYGDERLWKLNLPGGLKDGEGRNNTAASVAGILVASLPEELWELAGWAGLKDWNFTNTPPLGEKELRTTFDSIANKERSKRRGQQIEVYTLAELQHSRPAPPEFIIPHVLAVGQTLLVGHPKAGKSAFCLGLGLSVATGLPPFANTAESLTHYGHGFTSNKAGVLYLALEDNRHRFYERTAQMYLGSSAWPANFYITHKWPAASDGGNQAISNFLDQHPEVKLVIIDTLLPYIKKVSQKGDVFAGQYQMMEPTFQLAHEKGVCVLIIYHSRKGYTKDPTDAVAGTNGMSAVPDTVINLARQAGSPVADLIMSSRDFQGDTIHLRQQGTIGWRLEVPQPEEANAKSV